MTKKKGNVLYYGDNLDVLRLHLADESVDLVYLDPPFNSARTYNVLFAEQDGARAAAQIKAFEDTWQWDQSADAAYREIVEAGGKVSEVMRAFRLFAGDNDMLAYLAMMAPRLIELRRVLKSSGSLYLHCDPTASHYLKLLLDAVFGPENFQNEIIWSYRRWPSPSKHFQTMHDTLLFYSKDFEDDDRVFNVEYEESSESYKKRFGGKTQMLDPATGTRKITLDIESKGLLRRDVWELSILAGSSKERLGYPTQKPEALLERIIAASSNPGDVVLDPFCGCGTTVAASQRLGRSWIGIDITHLAVTLIKTRLRDAYGDDAKYEVIGEPTTVEDAEVLASEDPYQFQWWALGLVGARPADQKKGADRGIDGRLYFHIPGGKGKTEQIIISVKAGHVTVSQVRDLGHVVTREGAAIGVLISFEPSTQPMRKEALGAGSFDSPWGQFPKLQLLTVAQLLEGKKIDYPRVTGINQTFKQASRFVREQPAQDDLEGFKYPDVTPAKRVAEKPPKPKKKR